MVIPRLKRLYIGEFGEFQKYKILSGPSSKVIVDGTILCPFLEDVETNTSVLVSSSNHLKRLDYYIGIFGKPKKVPDSERLKQIKVINKVKCLYKAERI